MDHKVLKDINVIQGDNAEEPPVALISKKIVKKSALSTETIDGKDMLIAQLQEQISKQRECILYYENIVQLMNCRLVKLKKVLKAHKLLEEL